MHLLLLFEVTQQVAGSYQMCVSQQATRATKAFGSKISVAVALARVANYTRSSLFSFL